MAGSTVDQRCHGREARHRLAGARHAGARGHRCSPAVVVEDEEDKAEPARGSLEHEWWQRCGTMEAESGGGSSSLREWRRVRENSGVRGKGVGCSPFYRGRGIPGRRKWVVTAGVMVLTPLMVGAELRGVKEEF
jgi:hypothetical protein